MHEWIVELETNPVIKLVFLALLADVVFGILRSVKQHTLNSSFGIDGLLRKCGVVLAVIFLFVADAVTNINLVPFVDEDVLRHINLTSIGLTEIFGLLFAAFETLSVLKNMMVLGMPLPRGVKEKLEIWLKNNSDEMGDTK